MTKRLPASVLLLPALGLLAPAAGCLPAASSPGSTGANVVQATPDLSRDSTPVVTVATAETPVVSSSEATSAASASVGTVSEPSSATTIGGGADAKSEDATTAATFYERLKDVHGLQAAGKLTEALTELDDLAPLAARIDAESAAERARAAAAGLPVSNASEIQAVAFIEKRRAELAVEQASQAAFASAIEALGQDEPAARQAEETLWSNPRLAARSLAERLTGEPDGPRAARGLDLLRRLREPKAIRQVLQARVAPPSETASSVALAALAAESPAVGAGPVLLQIATVDSSEYRPLGAWSLLAVVPDPPTETFAAVAPELLRDREPLAAQLRAAANAARINRQTDLIGRRNLSALTPAQESAISALPARLAELAARKAETPAEKAIVAAASELSATLGLTESAPLLNLKIMAASVGKEAGPVESLIDGEWGSNEAEKNWRPRSDEANFVVIDLGAERQVDGVRLWNYNVKGQGYEAWKVAEIYVGDDPSTLHLAGTGVVARA
ncbi:MAG TPA: discoidin domain-containing protein, partial [Pirellulales bacterium]